MRQEIFVSRCNPVRAILLVHAWTVEIIKIYNARLKCMKARIPIWRTLSAYPFKREHWTVAAPWIQMRKPVRFLLPCFLALLMSNAGETRYRDYGEGPGWRQRWTGSPYGVEQVQCYIVLNQFSIQCIVAFDIVPNNNQYNNLTTNSCNQYAAQ